MTAFLSPALSFQQACDLKSREAYRGPVFWEISDDVSGIRVRRDVVRHWGSVVLPAVADGPSGPRVLLENSIATAPRYLWELPAGRVWSSERITADSGLESGIDRLAFQREHTEYTLVDSAKRFLMDETLQRFYSQREFAKSQ